MSDDLKPCPFCGKGPYTVTMQCGTKKVWHVCAVVAAELSVTSKTEQGAIQLWNTRTPQPTAPTAQEAVQALDWVDLGDSKSFRALLPIIGSVRVEPYGCCGWWEVLWSMPGQCDKLIPDVFDNPDDAKAAAQADYERRILAVLTPAPQPAASVDREALVALIEEALSNARDPYVDVVLEDYAKAVADALLAAGMVNRPEAVVHEEALHQTLADLAQAEATIAERDAENARLREALRFYANPDVYKPHPNGPAFDDRDLSFFARAALKETEHD